MLVISADEAEDESDVATHLIVWQLVRYAPREYRDAHGPALLLSHKHLPTNQGVMHLKKQSTFSTLLSLQ